MSYQIAQGFEYVGNDYWRWWTWIEAADAELDKVREVIWLLHPTFKRTRVRVADRESKFKLKTAGWGTFLLRAEVVLEGGDKQVLKHHLELEYPESTRGASSSKSTGSTPAVSPLTVFLSYSAQDSRVAAKLREQIKQAGLHVLDQTSIHGSELWSDAVRRLIAKADAVLALVCNDQISPWVRDELGAAVSADKRAFALLWPEASDAGIPDEVLTVRLDKSSVESFRITDLLRTVARS